MSDTISLVEPEKAFDFAMKVRVLEAFLLQHLPMVPFKNASRTDHLRVVLAWDGLHVVPLKITDLPPPSSSDLEDALLAFREDVSGVLAKTKVKATLPNLDIVESPP